MPCCVVRNYAGTEHTTKDATGAEVLDAIGARRLRCGIGTSEDPDAGRAGRSAAATALAGLTGAPAALILVYASVRYDLTELLDGVRAVTGDTPLAGATSSGQFHHGQVTAPGRGVAVLALTAGPYRFGVGAVSGVRDNAFSAGREMARAARAAASGPAGAERAPHGALLVLADGLAGGHQELLTGVHKVTGAAIPVVGGAAGDDRRLAQTFVFDGDQLLTDAAVGVWIASPWPLRVVAAHGWRPTGLPMLVTKADGTAVHEIGGQPAAEVFRSCYHEHHPPETDGSACRCPCCAFANGQPWPSPLDSDPASPVGSDPASPVGSDPAGPPDDARPREGYHSTHALGLIEPDGSMLIRGAYVDDDGLLRTFCPLPVYSAVQIVSCRPDDLLDVTDDIVAEGPGRARTPASCCCSAAWPGWIMLGDRGPEEAARLQAAAGDVATFGFYTYGEFARTSSVAGYHNATLAAIAL